MNTVNALPPPVPNAVTNPDVPTPGSPNYSALHPAALDWVPREGARILLLNSGEDGTITPVLQPFAEKGGRDKDRSDDPNVFTDPVRKGNMAKIELPETAEEWLKLAKAPNAFISEGTVRRLWNNVEDRNKAVPVMLEYLKTPPKRPLGVPEQTSEGPNGELILGAEDLKPSEQDRGSSIYDFQIDIDALELDPNNKTPIPDIEGRTPDMPDWVATFGKKISVEKVRDYLVHKAISDDFDPEMEPYLRKKFADQTNSGASLMERFKSDVRARALKYLAGSFGDTTAWSIEKITAESNKAAMEEISITTNTGPDEILRLVMKFKADGRGNFVDIDGNVLEGEPLALRTMIVEKFLKSDSSSYIQALASYEFTKSPHQDYYKFFQRYMDTMSQELGYGYDRTIGASIGMAYAHKPLGDVAKNSMFTNPVMRHEDGPFKGQEIWEPITRNGESVYTALDTDSNGNEVDIEVAASDVRDINTRSPYYLKDVTGPNGRVTGQVRVPILMEREMARNNKGRQSVMLEQRGDGSGVLRPVYFDTNSRPVLERDIIDMNGSNPHREIIVDGQIVQVAVNVAGGPVEHMVGAAHIPSLLKAAKFDKERVEIGKLKLREWIMEVGSRMAGQHFAFEPAQMEDVLEKVVEIGMRMRRSYYEPGIKTTDREGFEIKDSDGNPVLDAQGNPERLRAQKSLRVHRRRTRGVLSENRRPTGRKSAEYAESQTALTFLWIGLNKLLTNGPADTEGSEDGFNVAQLIQLAEDQKRHEATTGVAAGGRPQQIEYDPKMYAAGGMTNSMLPETARLLQSLVDQFPAAKQLPHGDYFTLEQQF